MIARTGKVRNLLKSLRAEGRVRFAPAYRSTVPFLGVPASGRPVEFEVIDILRSREGRITDHWVVLDPLGLLTQLGAMPASQAPTPSGEQGALKGGRARSLAVRSI